jgi:hypothetical protein
LELNQPVEMASDLETQLSASFDVGSTKYNPETQVTAWGHGRSTSSKCVNYGFLQVDDVLQDIL